MKSVYFILFSSFFTLSLQAQIILEESYNAWFLNVVQLDEDTAISYYHLNSSNELVITDANHNVTQSIPISIPQTLACTNCSPWGLNNASFLSRHLFDTNYQLEAVVSFVTFDTINSNFYSLVQVINESSQVLLSIEGGRIVKGGPVNTWIGDVRENSTRIEKKSENEYVLVVKSQGYPMNSYDRTYTVYSLPGYISFPTGILERVDDSGSDDTFLGNAYPNPSNGDFDIPFELENNDSGTLTLIDLNGKVIYEEPVSSAFNNLHFDAGQLASGSYIYTLTIDNQVVESKKLVVK